MTALFTPVGSAAPPRRRAAGRPVWEEPPTAAGQAVKGISLTTVVAVVIVPIYIVVVTSLSPQSRIDKAGGLVLVPGKLTFNAYRLMLSGGSTTRALIVSLGVTLVGTAFSMVVSVLCAYGLSRARSLGHRTLLMTLVVTMFFSGGIIPQFVIVAALGGFSQYWALILPSAVSVFNILVLRAFYQNTAPELIDAARMDGASEWRILRSVVLPTSRAANVVIALFYAVGYWNAFFNVLLYIPYDQPKWTLQYVIYRYVTESQRPAGMGTTGSGSFLGAQQVDPLSLQMATVVLSLIPIMVVYPFVQKHFTKGVLTGAIKG